MFSIYFLYWFTGFKHETNRVGIEGICPLCPSCFRRKKNSLKNYPRHKFIFYISVFISVLWIKHISVILVSIPFATNTNQMLKQHDAVTMIIYTWFRGFKLGVFLSVCGFIKLVLSWFLPLDKQLCDCLCSPTSLF